MISGPCVFVEDTAFAYQYLSPVSCQLPDEEVGMYEHLHLRRIIIAQNSRFELSGGALLLRRIFQGRTLD